MDTNKIAAVSVQLSEAGIKNSANHILAPETTFRIGGPCDIAAWPCCESQIVKAICLFEENKVPFITVGRASDLLFDDSGFRGAVLFLTEYKDITYEDGKVNVSAGYPLTLLAGKTADMGLSGLEFAYGIPGTVGGGVYMNAGAYGGQISDVFDSCRVYDIKKKTFCTLTKNDMNFSYRHSLLADNRQLIMLSAVFSLCAGVREEIRAKEEDFLERRRSKQPLEYPSAGSVFRRPRPEVYVGMLIEQAGLKGVTVGGAQVSEKHAGFIVNRGGATSRDVSALVELIQNKLYELYGIRPECEIISVPAEPGKSDF